MASTKQRARGHEKNAERLMKEAQRLYDSASPEQRERMQQWARQPGPQRPPDLGEPEAPGSTGGSRGQQAVRGSEVIGHDSVGGEAEKARGLRAQEPGEAAIRTDPVDARRAGSGGGSDDEAAREQVVAEWLGQGSKRAGGTAGAGEPSPETVQERLRAAARSAERAIGDRAVPGRYDRILREYFNRLPAKFAREPGGTADALPPAAAPAGDAPMDGKP